MSPGRTIAELKELRALTSDENGAQRVAFTGTWAKARNWLKAKLEELPVEIHRDEAGNVWATLRGASPQALLIGGHIDSVPNGGWLDGCLNILAGVEILRRINTQYSGTPPVTVRLVDWADEEGARFGRSLFGSSACSGFLDKDEARSLKDRDGIPLVDALAEHGIDFERVKESGKELRNAAAYLELHIEQGPVLLDRNLPLGTVLGTYGVERHAVTFRGQAAHSGSTPMNRRRDAFLAAARMSPEIYRIAERQAGVCTIGSCVTAPGIVTSVVEECRITLDQRHLDGEALSRMLRDAREASERFAAEGDVTVSWERLLRIDPILFNSELLALCDEAISETCGTTHRMPSGPLHDAAEVARAGIPTVMMFVQSLHGISHNKIEDTREEHIEMAVTAFDKLAEKVMKRIARVRCATAAFPVILRAQATPSLTQKKESHMEIKRNGSQPSAKGPSDWFTGTVRIDSPFKGTDPARVSGAIVTFEPGARTAWHTHPLGQTLIVTSGLGWVQGEDGPIEEIQPGDVVWFPPGEKHWHGAAPTTAMTHIAIQEQLDGKVVDWLEKVSDEQYRK